MEETLFSGAIDSNTEDMKRLAEGNQDMAPKQQLGTSSTIKVGEELFRSVPTYMVGRRQWVNWKIEYRGGKPTKVPYRPDGRKAKSNDPKTWSTHEDCMQAYLAGGFSGLGFVLCEGDQLTAIDLDYCLDDKGDVLPWAAEIVERFSTSYIERSPSGRGLHIWCFGRPLTTGQREILALNLDYKPRVEVYTFESPRFLTVTGDRFNEADLSDCQTQLLWIFQKYFAEDHPEDERVRQSDGSIDLEGLMQALYSISPDEYLIWIKVGMALKSAGLDFEVWDEWSQGSEKYLAEECASKWKTFDGDRLSLGTIYFYASKEGGSKDSGDAVDWTNPDSFGSVIPLGVREAPEIDASFLPEGWLKTFVQELAKSTQTPEAMAAMQSLAILAACLQNKFTVSQTMDDDYIEPLCLWVVTAMPPSSRKSSVLDALRKPITEWESEELARLKPQMEKVEAQRDITLRRIEELKKQASKEEQ